MDSLLRQILTEAKNKKVMFRCNAFYLWNYDCNDYITEWGYDIDQVIKTLNDVETERDNIHFKPAKMVKTNEELFTEYKDQLLKEIDNNESDYDKETVIEVYKDFMQKNNGRFKYGTDQHSLSLQFAEHAFYGWHWLQWELWNTGNDCLIDYDIDLEKVIDIDKITKKFEKDFQLFEKGLL